MPDRADRCLPWLRRRGSPLLGRSQDTFRCLPHSRGVVFSGTRVQRAVLQGITGVRLSPEALPFCLDAHGLKEGVFIVNRKLGVQPRSDGSTPIRVLMADPDESFHPKYRKVLSQDGFEVITALSGLECVARLR